MTAPFRLDQAGGRPLQQASSPPAPKRGSAAPDAAPPRPASPLLGAAAPPPRSLARQRAIVVTAVLAAALLTAAVSHRWFATGGLFRFVYALHDNVVLPVIGAVWTAWFPWGLLYLVPGAVMLALTIAGLLSGRRLASALHRLVIVAAARREFGQDLLRRVHCWQCAHGLPSGFMRTVIANAADAAVDAILLAQPEATGLGAALDRASMDNAWRLVALRSEMAAEAPREPRAGHAEATFATAAQIALMWLVAPPAEERTRGRLPVPWQAPRRVALDRQAGRLRAALGAIEGGIQEIEHRDGRLNRVDPAATPFSNKPWDYYAEKIITAVFLAGIAPEHGRLAMSVIDAVERVAIADLVSARDGAGAAARAAAKAIGVTDARRAASLIGAAIDRAAAGDLQSWHERVPGAKPGPNPGPGELAPALRGLAEAAADPRADAPPSCPSLFAGEGREGAAEESP